MKTVDNVRVNDVRYGQLESENRVAKMLRSIFTFIVLVLHRERYPLKRKKVRNG